MEYENTHEATRQAACENVKKIVNAIKAIRIKYYPNFARISEEDKNIYKELQDKLEKISIDNGLNNLRVALLEEISRYNGNEVPEVNKGEMKNPETRHKFFEEIKKACCGAIDVMKAAIAEGKLKKARKCQIKLEEYINMLNGYEEAEEIIKTITIYKREQLATLNLSKEEIKKNSEMSQTSYKEYLRVEDTLARCDIAKTIKSLEKEMEKTTETIDKGTQKTVEEFVK